MKKAWYLGLTEADVGDRAILIGDPDRVDRISRLLESPVHHPVTRGLKAVTGGYGGRNFTIAAFGMGAPIATIVLHELADLGVSIFLRIGTAMYFPPAKGGEFLVSEAAIGFEGTSRSYAGDGPFAADRALVAALCNAADNSGVSARTGLYATFDAFYRDMFGIDEDGRRRTGENRKMLVEKGVLAADMETSSLLAAAGALGVSCATLCLGTVDALSQEKLAAEALASGERQLFEIALDGLAALEQP